jgi:membrane protein YdbS with pleckstrin-like domain
MVTGPAGGGGEQTSEGAEGPHAGGPGADGPHAGGPGADRTSTGRPEPEWPDADWRRPSPRLRAVRHGQLALTTIPVLIAAVVLAVTAGAGAVLAAAAGVFVVVVAAVVDVFLGRRVRAWGYAERDDDLLVRRGVMFQRLSIIPYGRMQFVDVTAGPIERTFGLATVRMHTAAAASDARVPGLPASEAARLRDNLTALGEARAAGL